MKLIYIYKHINTRSESEERKIYLFATGAPAAGSRLSYKKHIEEMKIFRVRVYVNLISEKERVTKR